MFYKYNNFIGRIQLTTQADAYCPQGLSGKMASPSMIIFETKKTKIAHEPVPDPCAAAARAKAKAKPEPVAVTGLKLGVVPATCRYRKIMELQNTFLKNDGKLVWQKLGRDRVGYLATLGLMAVGTVMSLTIILKMSFPRPSTEE